MQPEKKSNHNESDYYSALNRSESTQTQRKQSNFVSDYTIRLEKPVWGYSVSFQISHYRRVA